MMRTIVWLVLWLSAGPLLAEQAIPPSLQHDLKVSLNPEQRSLRVQDRITLPDATVTLWLELHAGLNPRFHVDRGELKP